MTMPGGWQLVLVLGVLVLLFGSNKLPEVARSLGRSARVFKAETRGLREDEDAAAQPSGGADAGVPAAQNSTTQTSTAQHPVAQDSTTQNPTAEDPTARNAATQDPIAQNPTARNAATQDPAAQDPIGQAPAPQRSATAPATAAEPARETTAG